MTQFPRYLFQLHCCAIPISYVDKLKGSSIGYFTNAGSPLRYLFESCPLL